MLTTSFDKKSVIKQSKGVKNNMGVLEFIWTIISFGLAWVLLPSFLVSFVVVQTFRRVWIYVLSVCYPDLEFINSASVRSLVETRRNQGIITLLVAVRGQCRPDLVNKHVYELLERRDKLGNLLYPRLRQNLVSIWGCSAWRKTDFNLEQNLLFGSTSFRGRPLIESNLQDYVSEVVSKYLPQNCPPWQIFVIPNPTGSEDTYYLLVRIHHILISEEKNLRIGDLLMLKYIPTGLPGYQHEFENVSEIPKQSSSLLALFETPTAIPDLYEKLTENFSNRWNEFISTYDPLENPEILKTTPTISVFAYILIILTASVIREYRRGFGNIKTDPASKFKYFLSTIEKERRKRGIKYSTFIKSIIVTIDPRNIFKKSVTFFWWASVTCTLKTPILFYHELRAIHDCFTLHYCTYQSTVTAFVYNYIPLCYNALTELIYCSRVILEAPKFILNELMYSKFHRSPQYIPLCGRKVVCWSRKIGTKAIQDIATKIGATESDICLYATSTALKEFFIKSCLNLPKNIPITARNVNRNYIFSSGLQTPRPQSAVGGLVCLNLPVPDNEKDESVQHNIKTLKEIINTSRRHQSFSYFISILQTRYEFLTKAMPSVVIRVLLNYLSRVFTVTYTEITEGDPEHGMKTTVWGQEVDNVVYWRPPQANISLSLSVISYADGIRLAIMADALLSPHHVTLKEQFENQITQLVRIANST